MIVLEYLMINKIILKKTQEVVDQLNEIFKTKGKITYNMPDGF